VPLTQVEEGVVVVLHLEAPDTPESVLQVIIPDLKGRSLREAAAEASMLGLLLSAEGSGLIRRQNPPAGTRVRRGTALSVVAGPDQGIDR
jgi:stage V sporulation protein D (sporulation-specific penicillin-binding protein)